MKKLLIKLTALSLAALTLGLCSGCGLIFGADNKKEAEKALGLDLASAEVVESSDSHGGFLGDGLLFLKLDCGGANASEQIESSEHWKPLPVSANVSTLLYGGEGWSPIVKIDDPDGGVYDKPLFPEVGNGRYFFYDRYDNGASFDRYDDSLVLGRFSFNFTVAVYDADTDTLYYCEVDT